MRTKLLAATGVTACLLVLMAVFEAQASIWCPTPIPGVLMKYCLCQPFTGSAEVWTRSRLPPLRLVVLWNDLRQAANADWASEVQAYQQPRKFLSPRLRYACDIDRGYTVTRKVTGPSVTYLYSCYVKARPGPCGSAPVLRRWPCAVQI
jgi:hypothetical protein